MSEKPEGSGEKMELRLRQYKPCDADCIASWIRDEETFRKWSAGRFGDFPITGADINGKYIGHNGDCIEHDNFYPMTAFDESGAKGHLILRYTDAEKKVIRFGFVIVADSKRGKGYGTQMLALAQKYAFEIFGAEKITLGVFADNTPAYHCYKAAGFRETGEELSCELPGGRRIVEMEITKEEWQGRKRA